MMASAQNLAMPTQAPLQTTSDGLASTSTSFRQSSSQQSPCYTSNSTSQLSSSPRQLPSDLPDAILEEGAESGSDSLNDSEPVTPTSRHSQDFKDVNAIEEASYKYLPGYDYSRPNPNSSPVSPQKTPLPSRQPTDQAVWRPAKPQEPVPAPTTEPEPEGTPLSRRSTRSSTASFKRTMSSLFRRSNSNMAPPSQQINGMTPPPTSNPTSNANGNGNGDGITLRQNPSNHDSSKRRTAPAGNGPPPTSTNFSNGPRRFSFTRSTATTRSNTPPSPGSPLEPSQTNPPPTSRNEGMPGDNDFDQKKKNRSSTGLSLRGRTINFLSTPKGGPQQARGRRASSFESERADSKTRASKKSELARSNWALSPEQGTGAKARRMSLSLPDDFTVDVAELSSEYEYQSKFLGRHGKHLGKGAASKVTLMARKGAPEELYAVKEFRGKSGRESKEDYDKKIKSEFSIAKSLHHPNIIETIRLCSDHSRWNHVMEYCSEGDLFGLVSKGFLKDEKHKKDRLCLFKQLIQGVNYLHQNGIAHRDIKLENLLMTKDSKLKITDFGVSEVFSGTHPGLRESGGQCGRNMDDVRLCDPGICGSEPYIAPEVLAKKEKYDPRPLDVWSTAIVMIYLTFGGAIWSRAAPGNEHYDALVRGWDKWYSKHEADAAISDTDYPHHKAFDLMVSPPALRRVLLQMLNPDPTKRITMDEVINNRWMKNVECCQLESYDDPSQIIDATKSNANWKNGHKKIFCHSHLPAKSHGHSLGPMPGQPGY